MSSRNFSLVVRCCHWGLHALPRLAILIILGIAAVQFLNGVAPDGERPWPSFQEVEHHVQRHFGSQSGHQPNDLISQHEVQTLLERLGNAGWNVPRSSQLLSHVLPDDHLLVRELRTADGQKFMREISQSSLIYDRLDRISDEPGGAHVISRLILQPDAQKFVRERTERGDSRLVELMPLDRNGTPRRVKNLNKRTGKIYTSEKLIDRLHELHTEATKAKFASGTKTVSVESW